MNATQARSRHTGFRIISTTVISMLFLALLAVFATPASADTVNGAGGNGIHITVYTGNKNYSNHTQYVGWIYMTDAYDPGYCDAGDPVEAWAGNVYYYRTNGCGGQWFYVNSSVPSGSGVCASYWRWYYIQQSWPGHSYWAHWRGVACITIRV
ncbi:hypothetical protein [uncultured Jatrophihabitans sp.]|uniref:hypothetical protein n=1 Tax=uncultured Jatrophihabitans sp. TaxID=1610747 RepID=UPI0035CB9060